jgi:hypothetical protein
MLGVIPAKSGTTVMIARAHPSPPINTQLLAATHGDVVILNRTGNAKVND